MSLAAGRGPQEPADEAPPMWDTPMSKPPATALPCNDAARAATDSAIAAAATALQETGAISCISTANGPTAPPAPPTTTIEPPDTASFGAESTDAELISALLNKRQELRSLHLVDCRLVSDAVFEPEAPSPPYCALALTSLSVVRCPHLVYRRTFGSTQAEDSPLLQLVGRTAPTLTSLTLEGCTSLSDASLATIVAAACGGGSDGGSDGGSGGGSDDGSGGGHGGGGGSPDADAPRLSSLSLSGCRAITSAGIACLGRLAALTSLDLSSCSGLSSLPAVAASCGAQIAHLSLANCRSLTTQTLIDVASCLPKLERLNISGTGVRDDAVCAVASACPRLAYFNATRCAELTDDATVMLCVRCQRLESLMLARCAGVGDVTLEVAGGFCAELRELHLAGCAKVTDAGVAAVARGCPRLHMLAVDTCAGITDEAIRSIATHCPSFASLTANGCSGLGDESLLALVNGCSTQTLTRIDVRGCARVGEAGLEACARSLPACKVFANSTGVVLS